MHTSTRLINQDLTTRFYCLFISISIPRHHIWLYIPLCHHRHHPQAPTMYHRCHQQGVFHQAVRVLHLKRVAITQALCWQIPFGLYKQGDLPVSKVFFLTQNRQTILQQVLVLLAIQALLIVLWELCFSKLHCHPMRIRREETSCCSSSFLRNTMIWIRSNLGEPNN